MATVPIGLATSVVAVILAVTPVPVTAQTDMLYVCTDPGSSRVVQIGVAICDAIPTDALAQRLEPDNLQQREGVLITEIVNNSVAQLAGLQHGDLIYRVGGVNVEDNVETAARLSLIGDTADTVVNFLRSGRPYRVKIRQR